MMRGRGALIVSFSVLLAVLIQSTLFGRVRIVTPDLVMLVVIVLALTKIKVEVVLAIGFTAGLIVDLLGSSLLGLRAIVFTTIAYVAVRTKERAELGRITVAVWAGFLTLVGMVLLILVGTLFGQSSLLGQNAVSRMILVPLANTLIAALLAPTYVRLVDGDRTAMRYP
jgi:rod shape-determining protein MreD